MLELWMNDNTQIIAKLSKASVWNQHNQKIEKIHNGREELKNILGCVHLKHLCNVINHFTELIHNF